MMQKLLVAFDFDHTIIEANSDIVIRKLIPNNEIPDDIKHLYRSDGWTTYMQEIFKILHRIGISKEKVIQTCHTFEETNGMINLITELKKTLGADIIIISDSNSVFIEEWLKYHNLSRHIDRVYTNPAKFNEEGLLTIQKYHKQDWCKLSTKNLCKGYILESYIKEQIVKKGCYNVVAYVGDGKNDLCPILKLRSVDHCFPRIGYTLMNSINEVQASKTQLIQAKIHPWNDGDEILKILKQICT